MAAKEGCPTTRVLTDISRAHTAGQIEKIAKSPQVGALPNDDKQVVAAAISGRVLGMDFSAGDNPGSEQGEDYSRVMKAGLDGAILPYPGA